jgi:GDP-L-fucose synthase
VTGARKVLITGGSGMLGSAFEGENIIKTNSREFNLTNFTEALNMFRKYQPTHVIHLAAKVGGVKANTDNMADFYRDNILINTNVLEAARMYKTQKVLSLMSTCVYPADTYLPLEEASLHDGSPHPSNFGYAHAKRALDVQSRAYRQQYGCNFITAIPNNLFGEHDNFDLENSHVIPAMIRKIYEAKINNKSVVLWGDGSPLREFTYAKNMARALMFVLDRYNEPAPINVGNTTEHSIKHVAETIADILKFEGEIIWDVSKPAGQFRKPSCGKKMVDLGWDQKAQYTTLRGTLGYTCKWFVDNYPNVRGV